MWKIVGFASDRKDYYHQARVTTARALSNSLPFSYTSSELGDCKALVDVDPRPCSESLSGPACKPDKKASVTSSRALLRREAVGDFLVAAPKA